MTMEISSSHCRIDICLMWTVLDMLLYLTMGLHISVCISIKSILMMYLCIEYLSGYSNEKWTQGQIGDVLALI
eukprot:UN24535